MLGKTLKVVEYELTFGTNAKLVNVFGVFRYKKNNNLYVVFSDDNAKDEIVYYGSSHVKNNTVLSMSTRGNDEEIVKKFIYNIINNEDLSEFEIVDLSNVEGIEIITSNKLSVKLDDIRQLENLTIPLKEETQLNEENLTKVVQNSEIVTNTAITDTGILENKEEGKKVIVKSNKKILIILIVVIVFGGGLILFSNKPTSTLNKKIICTKGYAHDDLDVDVTEENTYVFSNGDNLSDVETIYIYKFDEEEEYQSFINKGTFHKYISDDANTKWEKDDDLYTFTIISERNIDDSYKGIRGYEEVIKSYSSSGYDCEEKIEEE